MKLNVIDLAWSDLRQPNITEWLLSMRDTEPKLYRLRFTKLPWVSLLLCTPKNYILCMNKALETDTHARWHGPHISSEKVRAVFVQEHVAHNLKPADIPWGFYDYGSYDQAEPEVSRIGGNVEPLPDLWFTSFLVPQTMECEEIMIERIKKSLESIGWYFMRPLQDEHANHGFPSKYFMTESEKILCESYKGLGYEYCYMELLKMMEPQNYTTINRELLSTERTYYGRCMLPFGSNDGDKIAAMRSKLIRILDWPIFVMEANRALQYAKSQYIPKLSFSFNPVEDLEAYIESCHRQYPVLKEDPFLDVWKGKRMIRMIR